jgi:antitoxin (DNA-binding transcriptional repressor) of toxin-antitoxin stability system
MPAIENRAAAMWERTRHTPATTIPRARTFRSSVSSGSSSAASSAVGLNTRHVKTLTATEVSRNFSRVLDDLEHGGEEVVIVRGKHPVAKLVPGAPRLTALEALGDLYRTLDDAEGRAWLDDMVGADRPLRRETRDPWA